MNNTASRNNYQVLLGLNTKQMDSLVPCCVSYSSSNLRVSIKLHDSIELTLTSIFF